MILILTTLFGFLHASRSYSDISVGSLDSTQGITITSQGSAWRLGSSIKNAGDFNGDGYDDVVIGSPGANGNTGTVHVIFGSKNGLSDLEVSSGMTASKGLVIKGATGSFQLGCSVSTAGDVNNDGIDDIIIGAYMYDSARGAAYVIYGSETPPAIIDLSQGLNINQGFAVTGESFSNYLGISVSNAGDVNNDTIDDVIIGAYGVSFSQGAAYVIFGKKGTRNHMNMASGLGSSEGFAILGDGGSFGRSVSNAGDIDGDGIGDIIVGASSKIAAFVIYGSNTIGAINLSSGLSQSQGFSIRGTSTSSQFGYSVSSAGDFNGDGRADLLIGAPGESFKGAAYVIFGNDRSALGDINLSSGPLDSSRGIRIGETNSNVGFGWSVSGAGDINNDGVDDIIIGSYRANSNAGAAYVIFGSKSLTAGIVPSSGLGSNEGFRIFGDQSSDVLGGSVSYASDVNGDGMPDLIIGAYGVRAGKGAAYLLFSPLVCLEECETCSTAKKCLTCKTGYGLDDFSCIECPVETDLVDGVCVTKKSSLGTATEVAKGLFDSGSTASRIFTMGRSLSVGLGLIGKIIQNVRFLDIDYPEETVEVFKTYGTDLFELPVPEAFYESPETKELSSQYARYDTEPSFLENYWDTIMTMLISFSCFLVIKFVQFLTKSQRKDHIFQVALKNVGQTAANFFIIQIYANLDDVIFYLLLDIQSTKLSSPSAGISLGAAILFLVIGLALVFFHCWLLGKYQQAKSQDVLERFEAKYRVLGTLFEDFKDDSIAKQSFFGILILRCIILILVITLLQPQWMQGTLLMLTNLIFLAYFIHYRPFKSRFDEVVQYFCELTVFAAYLSVLILSILDAQNVERSSLRNGLGKCIVIAGITLALGGFIVQVIQITGVMMNIYKFIKNYYYKKEVQVLKLDSSPDIKTVNRLSESSASILKHTSPRNLNDQLELISNPHNNRQRRRINLENPRKNNSEVFSHNNNDPIFQHHNNPIFQHNNGPKLQHHQNQNSEETGHWANMPKKEEDSPQKITPDQPKLQVFTRPLGSRIHQQNREESTLNSSSYMGLRPMNKTPLRRKKIKRNAIRPDLPNFDHV